MSPPRWPVPRPSNRSEERNFTCARIASGLTALIATRMGGMASGGTAGVGCGGFLELAAATADINNKRMYKDRFIRCSGTGYCKQLGRVRRPEWEFWFLRHGQCSQE